MAGPNVYEQPNLICNINGKAIPSINRITVIPKAAFQISAVTTDAHPSSRKTGDPRSNFKVEFGQAISAGDITFMRGLVGGPYFTISVKDPSGTTDGVVGANAFFEQNPDFDRANQDMMITVSIDALNTTWGN